MENCKEIAKVLKSGEIDEKREAAFLAGEHQCREAIPALAQLLLSDNLGLQEAADMALRKLGGVETADAVIPLLRSDEAPVRNLSMDILREIGNQAMPSLVKLLHDEDADVRIFVSDILGSSNSPQAVPPLGELLLKDPEVNVRYQAAVSLGELQMKAGAKYLNQALNDEEWIQFAVIEALAKVRDDSSIGALAKAMSKSSDLVASMIVEALGEMGNVKAVPMLLVHLETSPTALRNKIVKAIVNILGGKSLTLLSEREREKFREYLLVAIHDEEEDIQDAAILGLGHVGGAKASEEVLRLAAQMDGEREPERLESAVSALATIGHSPALRNALHSGDNGLALVAVNALGRIPGDEVCGVMSEAFWDCERDVQRALILALSNCGAAVKEFFLDVLARHNDGTVLKGALAYFGNVLKDPGTGDTLFSFLEHPYDDVKEAALDACVNVGGPEMGERFRTLFRSPEPIHRLMAVYAMGKLDIGAYIEEIKLALEDEIPDIRKVALESFSELCVELVEWLPVIESRMRDENREVRLAVVDLMGSCEDRAIVPHLMGALDDEDDWVRVRAIEALGRRQASEAIVRLVELLDVDSPLVQIKAVEALGSIGGKMAFRALLNVVNSDNPELAAAAEEALERIQGEQEEEER
ncbi:HEAT repeat protein [Desulfobaculum xiamenense]|uniref:HEAT repeat protein n=1 Tax=Desulfobaculum xiamenense TaxID=995050 RepID=A0A846QWD9_9BACT|nr:HEAT repeat domain-containing protein [Desulfobaculum xiamenense]NJB69424.1 HEAT repeat protein [Desulfobaculum xiamenense]